MTVNKLYEPQQSAYSSTETALVKVQNDTRMVIHDNKPIILDILDTSAVFNIVDHNLLLLCIMTPLGIGGNVLT